jgi:uncharacterized phage-associated protein
MKRKMLIKTTDIAKDVIFLCTKYGYDFNNTKVQKLIYLFIGFCLMNDVEAIKNIDELPKAWQYGPVFPKVYKKYSSLIGEINNSHILSINDDKMMMDIFEKTIKFWGRVPASKLSEWSHKESSPWDIVINKNKEKWNAVIPLEMMYNYFSENVENVLNEASESGFVNFLKKMFA